MATTTAPAASALPADAALAGVVDAVRRAEDAARDAVEALATLDADEVVREEGLDVGAALRLHTRASPADVAMYTGAAETLASRPVTATLFTTRVLSWGHVRQLLVATRRFDPDQVAALEDHLDRHRDTLAAVDADRLTGILDDAVTQHTYLDTLERASEREVDGNRFVLSPKLDGTASCWGTFDREGATLLADTLLAEADRPRTTASPTLDDDTDDVAGSVLWRPRSAQLADALLHICHQHRAATTGSTSAATRFTVTVDLDTVTGQLAGRLRTALAGYRPAITGQVLDRLACDAALDVVVRDGTDLLAAQRYAPDITAAVRRAVVARDGGCRFPSCTAPPAWCDVHHVISRAESAAAGLPQGDHGLANLVLLCRRHHTVVHRRSWRQSLTDDGAYTLRRRGRTWTTLPRATTDLPAPDHPPGRRPRRRARARPPDPSGTLAATGTDPPDLDLPDDLPF